MPKDKKKEAGFIFSELGPDQVALHLHFQEILEIPQKFPVSELARTGSLVGLSAWKNIPFKRLPKSLKVV